MPSNLDDLPPPAAGALNNSNSAAARPLGDPDTRPMAGTAFTAPELDFLVKAWGVGRYDLAAARLGMEKATDSAVKSYASLMMDTHAASSNDLKQVAATNGAFLADQIPPDKQREIEQLSQSGPESFDREFMQRVAIVNHESEILLFEQAAQQAQNPALKAYIDRTLPTLRQQLALAQRLPVPGGIR